MLRALLLSIVLTMALSHGILFADVSELEGEEPVMSSSTYEISDRTRRMSDEFELDVIRKKTAKRAHKGLDTLIRIAAYALSREGYKSEAKKLLKEWDDQYSSHYLESYTGERHIGDFAVVSKWLKDQTDKLSFLLGSEIFYRLRLSDIQTFNETPKTILFCPDKVSEPEYFLHWVHDPDVYKRGLAPTTMFWICEAGCLGASLSTGFAYCAPICSGAEWLTKSYVAPKTNHMMWSRSCDKGE